MRVRICDHLHIVPVHKSDSAEILLESCWNPDPAGLRLLIFLVPHVALSILM